MGMSLTMQVSGHKVTQLYYMVSYIEPSEKSSLETDKGPGDWMKRLSITGEHQPIRSTICIT